MAHENEANIPHCNSKENGAINLFIKPITGDYAKNRYNTLLNRKYTTIEKFIEDFFTQVQMDYERFRQFETLSTVVGDTLPTAERPPPRPTPKPEDKKPYSNDKKSPGNKYQGGNNQRAHNMSEHNGDKSDTEDIDDDREQYESIGNNSEPEENNDDEPPPSTKDSDDEEDYGGSYDRGDSGPMHKSPETFLANLTKPYKRGDLKNNNRDSKDKPFDRTKQAPKPDAKRERNGCWNMLRDGVCENGNKCKFSHDPEDIKKSWASLDQMLKRNEKKFGSSTQRKPGGEPATSSE
jgi:hypothetical protein